MYPYIYRSTDLTIGSYGVMLAIAYLVGRHLYISRLLVVSKKINVEILIISLLIFGVIGAKIMFIIKNPSEGSFFNSLTSGVGFSSQGAILAAILVLIVFSTLNKIALNLLLDNAATPAILSYAIARIGCFLAGDDCHGIASNLPWAMSFPNGIEKTNIPVHPVPLYEIFYSMIIWLYINYLSKANQKPYYIFFMLLLCWGACRFLIEFVSTNSIKILGMSGSQFGALLMFIVASVYFFVTQNQDKKKPE